MKRDYVKKTISILLLFLLPVFLLAEEEDMYTMSDDLSYYAAITRSADYTVKPEFKPLPYSKHDLIEDIKVTAVESIPFAFILTFAGLWATKAIENKTWSPNVGTLKDNQQIYYIAIGSFMAVNVAVNVFTFYDYSGNSMNAKIQDKQKEKTAVKN
jgi:hypothetical protein